MGFSHTSSCLLLSYSSSSFLHKSHTIVIFLCILVFHILLLTSSSRLFYAHIWPMSQWNIYTCWISTFFSMYFFKIALCVEVFMHFIHPWYQWWNQGSTFCHLHQWQLEGSTIWLHFIYIDSSLKKFSLCTLKLM